MDLKKGAVIKYSVGILAALNLIWLFGFGYRVPSYIMNRSEIEDVAEAASTATTRMVSEVIEEEDIEEEEKPEEEQVVRCRVTAASRLNIRMGPGTNYEVVTTANYDEILIVLGSENGWIHVRNDAGQEGYVSETYVEILDE